MSNKALKHLLLLLVFIVAFTELGVRWWDAQPGNFKLDPANTDAQQTTPLYHEQFISFNETAAVHAPTISQRKDGSLIAIWYAGTREGAKDVNLFQTVISPQDSHIQTPPRAIASRLQTQQDSWRYIRKLGNPIVATLSGDRLMLLYTGVSFGGWAASRLYVRFSDDNGQTWGKATALVSSPFLNISTLVKGAPVEYINGDIGIPVYHEFLGKFGELLLLDANGQVKNKRRMSWGRDSIQPVIAPLNKQHAIALFRDSGEVNKKIGFSETRDAGSTWATPAPLQLPNPNAAVALATDSNSTLLAIFNNDPEERYDMSLAISQDQGKNWKTIHAFDKGTPEKGQKFEFSYPYLIHDGQGNFHLVYTWHKKRIKYVHFNLAWLEQRL